MATSGVYRLSYTRNNIIYDALSLIGAASVFRNPSAGDYETGNRWLNYLIKAWQKKGLRPTQQVQIVVFLDTVSNEFILGPGGSHAAYTYDFTEASADANAGDNTIVVDDVLGFVVGNPIGIEQTINFMQWTTISSITGNVIGLTDVLTGAVSSGNTVFTYPTTAAIQTPLRFNNCQRALTNGTEAMVGIENRKDYFDISNKTIQGYPTQLHYSPQINNGQLYIFPISSDTTIVLKATVEYPLEIFTASNQTAPFPDEWVLALIYGLAALMAPVFGFFGTEGDKITAMAGALEADIIGTDVEDNFIQFTPDVNGDYAY